MKLHSGITINGKPYAKGTDVPGYKIYPFFLLHMLAFGGSGFFMAYGANDVSTGFLFLHGGFAILVYTVFYVALFGWDEVRWMFINAVLGIYGLWSEIGWILGAFGKQISDFPWYRHVVPFGYYVLYTFLLRHMLLDLFDARGDETRRRRLENGYVLGTITFYTLIWLAGRWMH
jgi:hypothetical protein